MRQRIALGIMMLAVCLQANSQSERSAENLSFAVAVGQARYQARETSASGGLLNMEKGVLPSLTLRGQWQQDRWFADVSHLLARHDVVYEGYTQLGIPLQTATQLAWSTSALSVGRFWPLNERSDMKLQVGLDHLQIDRQIRAALGSLPLHETLGLTRGLLGLHWSHGEPFGWRWEAGVDVLRRMRSQLKVDTYGLYDPITLQPGNGTDWRFRVQAAYRWQGGLTGFVTVSQDTVRPGASSQEVWSQQGRPVLAVRYPGSHQTLKNLQAGVAWQF